MSEAYLQTEGHGGYAVNIEGKTTMKKYVLKDFGRGAHFFLGKTEFVVQEHFRERCDAGASERYTFVEAANDVLYKGPFDMEECNNWRKSSLRAWLNMSYFERLMEDCPALKDAAVPFLRDLTSDDGLKDYGTCKDTVSLMTAEEYRRYRDLHREAPKNWRWLITPHSTDGCIYVRCVTEFGSMSNTTVSTEDGAVRPVLYLKSGIMVSVEEIGEV